jgi:predicted glycosyltransferase
MPNSAYYPESTREALMQAGPPKILLASNEIFGIGHLRIVLRLAAYIQAELTDASMLLLTASTIAHAFPLPKGLDVIQIPGIGRSNEGVVAYRPLRLPLAFEQVKKLRERIIGATARTYHPDLFLVDFRPGGVAGELLPTLRALKRQGETALVLLLRDIVDGPEIVRVRWRADRAMQALEYYDEIWVYGCQNLYDPIREYQLPAEIARKIRFCGYLDIEAPVAASEDIRRMFGIAGQPFVLVTIGSGRLGFPVLDTYVRALAQIPDGLDLFSLIVGGPSLPMEQQDIIRRQCEAISSHYPRRRVHFVNFLPRLLDYMAAADVVVSQGGYNTVTEILRLGKCAVVVPEVSYHDEQLIRASLFESFGLIRTIHPNRLSPQRLAETILAALQDEPPTHQRLLQLGFDFDGLQHIKDHVMRLLKRGATT